MKTTTVIMGNKLVEITNRAAVDIPVHKCSDCRKCDAEPGKSLCKSCDSLIERRNEIYQASIVNINLPATV